MYSITIHSEPDARNYMMRISLPVDPKYKTLSEVTTVEYILSHTNIPVPKIYAHNADNGNDIKFEWILMEKMSGKRLEEVWENIPWEKKQTLVDKIANYCLDRKSVV